MRNKSLLNSATSDPSSESCAQNPLTTRIQASGGIGKGSPSRRSRRSWVSRRNSPLTSLFAGS